MKIDAEGGRKLTFKK
jgi:hypothetical protein